MRRGAKDFYSRKRLAIDFNLTYTVTYRTQHLKIIDRYRMDRGSQNRFFLKNRNRKNGFGIGLKV